MKIPLIKPYITESIKQRVCDVLDSGYLTEGPVTREFENKLKEYLGCDYLHSVTSATTGLEVALRALEIGLKIKTFNLKGDSFSVDVLDDYKKAKKQMACCWGNGGVYGSGVKLSRAKIITCTYTRDHASTFSFSYHALALSLAMRRWLSWRLVRNAPASVRMRDRAV